MAIKERRGLLMSALLFTLYILAFLLTENAVNVGAERFSSVNVSAAYAVGLFCTAAGYLLFPVSRCVSAAQSARKPLLMAVSAAFALSVVMFLATRSAAVFLVFSCLSLACFGYIGGMVHYRLSVSLQSSGYTGRVVGVSCAAATLVQFAIQNLFDSNVVLVLSVFACTALIFLIAARAPERRLFENTPLRDGSAPKKELLVLAVTVFLMSAIMSVNDGILTSLHAQGAVNVLSWPRLFYALSVCAAGFIADLRDRKYMPLATVCALLLSVVAFAFLQSPATYALNACVLYFYSGFYVLFLTVGFLDAAPPTEDERLADFSAQDRLTPRESEVLAAVSASEKTLGALALELGISERVLQRYLSSIYEKTGTQTRYGLAMSLHGIKLKRA